MPIQGDCSRSTLAEYRACVSLGMKQEKSTITYGHTLYVVIMASSLSAG